jgi:hypothetical protein
VGEPPAEPAARAEESDGGAPSPEEAVEAATARLAQSEAALAAARASARNAEGALATHRKALEAIGEVGCGLH